MSTEPWRRFLKTMVGAFAGMLAALAGFIFLMNPYGNLPQISPLPHVITDSASQRFHYPAIIRSGHFDSAVFGTSSSRLLNPSRLDADFGGTFANLALNASSAWEQLQLFELFLKSVAAPRTLIFGVEWAWCQARLPERPAEDRWPRWMSDENRWNDWLYVLNGKSLELARRSLEHHLGIREVRTSASGYGVFVPPEEEYDPVKVSRHLWGGHRPTIPPMKEPYHPTRAERAAWRFPALPWLKRILEEAPASTTKVVTFMPGHISTQPAPGTRGEARTAECKRQIEAITKAGGATFVDFWIRSPITLHDENYWDPSHYRVPVGDRIVDDIAAAVRSPGRNAGDYHVVPPDGGFDSAAASGMHAQEPAAENPLP
jgi:hypothetical protein